GGTQSLRLRNVPLLVYDYDNTPLSRTYLETYGAALTFRFTPHAPDESPEFALNSWRGRAALIIPPNFERDVHRGAAPVVQLMIDPGLLGALTTAKEYEVGTVIQAYTSSLTAVQCILGKAMLYVVIGLVDLVICFTLGLIAFGFRFPSDPTVLLVATLLYLMGGVFFGMMMGN